MESLATWQRSHFHFGGWSLRIRSIFYLSLVVALRQRRELLNANRQGLVRTDDLLPECLDRPEVDSAQRSQYPEFENPTNARECDLVRGNVRWFVDRWQELRGAVLNL